MCHTLIDVKHLIEFTLLQCIRIAYCRYLQERLYPNPEESQWMMTEWGSPWTWLYRLGFDFWLEMSYQVYRVGCCSTAVLPHWPLLLQETIVSSAEKVFHQWDYITITPAVNLWRKTAVCFRSDNWTDGTCMLLKKPIINWCIYLLPNLQQICKNLYFKSINVHTNDLSENVPSLHKPDVQLCASSNVSDVKVMLYLWGIRHWMYVMLWMVIRLVT